MSQKRVYRCLSAFLNLLILHQFFSILLKFYMGIPPLAFCTRIPSPTKSDGQLVISQLIEPIFPPSLTSDEQNLYIKFLRYLRSCWPQLPIKSCRPLHMPHQTAPSQYNLGYTQKLYSNTLLAWCIVSMPN